VLVECVEDVIEDLAPQMAGEASARTERAHARLSESTRDVAVAAAVTTHGRPMMQPKLKDAATGDAFKRSNSINSGNLPAGLVAEGSKQIQSILNCLTDAQSLHIDAVIETCQLPPQTVLNLLLELELMGMVVQHPGKLFTLP
jgi:predicted Rossmann fold nucleotide-binding protein DprA/Smf involved in DNA uptake